MIPSELVELRSGPRNSRVNFIQWKSSLQNVYFLGKEVRSRAGMYSVPRPFVPIVFILGSSIVGSRNCFETGSRQSVNTILIDTVLCLKVRFYSFETFRNDGTLFINTYLYTKPLCYDRRIYRTIFFLSFLSNERIL